MGKKRGKTRFIRVKPANENQTINTEGVGQHGIKLDDENNTSGRKTEDLKTTEEERIEESDIEVVDMDRVSRDLETQNELNEERKEKSDMEVVEIDKISREFKLQNELENQLTSVSRRENNDVEQQMKDTEINKTEKSPPDYTELRRRNIKLEPIKKLNKVVKNKKEKSSKKKKKEIIESAVNKVDYKKNQAERVVEAALGTEGNAVSDGKKENKKSRKLPSCLGFITSWIAKRKENRRQKKKKAIKSRENTPTLVQYEHKKARGGEAFVIEIDDTPRMLKPVLPPIQRAAGPIRLGTDARLQTAEAKRNEVLGKRQEHIRSYERRRNECVERKRSAEVHFQTKTQFAIQTKQADAERNRTMSRLSKTPRPLPKTPRPTISLSSSESDVIEGDEFAFTGDRYDLS